MGRNYEGNIFKVGYNRSIANLRVLIFESRIRIKAKGQCNGKIRLPNFVAVIINSIVLSIVLWKTNSCALAVSNWTSSRTRIEEYESIANREKGPNFEPRAKPRPRVGAGGKRAVPNFVAIVGRRLESRPEPDDGWRWIFRSRRKICPFSLRRRSQKGKSSDRSVF